MWAASEGRLGKQNRFGFSGDTSHSPDTDTAHRGFFFGCHSGFPLRFTASGMQMEFNKQIDFFMIFKKNI